MAAVEAKLELFTAACTKVVVVSFGNIKKAAEWLKDTGCNLEMFLDSDRELYIAMGLHRSVAKVWNMATVNYYAGEKARGRQVVAAIEGVEDDPLQMGGDFTVRSDGKVMLSHPSKNPKDRPSVSSILEILS